MIPRRLVLTAWKPQLDGCGNDLELSLEAYHETKGRGGKQGKTHGTSLVLKLDRGQVRLAEQIAEMQTRDRQRIERELDRLKYEVAPLVRT